jgi:hypothetical protein
MASFFVKAVIMLNQKSIFRVTLAREPVKECT